MKTIFKEVTEKFIKNYHEKGFYDKRPKPYFNYDINCGDCESWAIECKNLLNKLGIECKIFWQDEILDPEIYDDLPYHCVLFLNNKYYDAECYDGVLSILELPINKRNPYFTREEIRRYFN
jgi:hypothetical protein